LMQINDLEKAYKVFKQASKNIQHSDILKIMETEIRLRLLDFTGIIEKSIEIFEKYHEYGENIFSYYTAVAFLHYCEFDKSRRYLDTYKAKGRVDKESLELVNRVESRLDILQNQKKLIPNGKAHPVGIHAFNAHKNSKSIKLPKRQAIIFDAPSLYILFKESLTDWLKECKEIMVTFTTIDRLQKDYCDTGDEVLKKIIHFIRESENVKIKSPSIASILNNRGYYSRGFQDYYDSLRLSIESNSLFATSYHQPISFKSHKPIFLPLNFKVIRFINGELQIYYDNIPCSL